MRLTLPALAAAAALAAATAAVPSTASAQCRGPACAGAVGLGILGGAIVGGAIASSAANAYAPAPGYVPYPAYGAPYPAACPGGYWARRPLLDPYGNVVGYSRPRFFCPP
jgi:hypothetical protein